MPVFHHFLSIFPKNSLHKLLIMDYTYLNISISKNGCVQKHNKKEGATGAPGKEIPCDPLQDQTDKSLGVLPTSIIALRVNFLNPFHP